MPYLNGDPLTQSLRQTNQRLRFWLESLELPPSPTTPLMPQLVAGLLSELLQAGERLRSGLPESPGLALEDELREYRRNLERLRERMPGIHKHLLEERARLEAERTRLEAAEEWAQGSRQILSVES